MSPYTVAVGAQLLWAFPVTQIGGGYVTASSPTIAADGTIYVAGYQSGVFAINPDGTQKWEAILQGGGQSPVAVGADGTLYATGRSNALYAIHPDGTQSWVVDNPALEQYLFSNPTVVADGTIYSGQVAVHANGTAAWVFERGTIDFRATPAVASNGTVFLSACCYNANLIALNPNGTPKWQFPHSSGATPALGSDGAIYLDEADSLYAINPNGDQRWVLPLGQTISGSAALADDGSLEVSASDGNLYRIGPDGSALWQAPVGGAATTGEKMHAQPSSPVIDGAGVAFVGGVDGSVHAIGSDGTEVGVFATPTGAPLAQPPAIGSDGTLYITSTDGSLYAFGNKLSRSAAALLSRRIGL